MNFDALISLFSTQENINAGLDLLRSLCQQTAYSYVLKGWSFENHRFVHPTPPFSDAIAWVLWQEAPELTFELDSRTLFIEHPVAHLPQQHWERLQLLDQFSIQLDIPLDFPTAFCPQRLEWRGPITPTSLLNQVPNWHHHAIPKRSWKTIASPIEIYTEENAFQGLHAFTFQYEHHSLQWTWKLCYGEQAFVIEIENDIYNQEWIRIYEFPLWMVKGISFKVFLGSPQQIRTQLLLPFLPCITCGTPQIKPTAEETEHWVHLPQIIFPETGFKPYGDFALIRFFRKGIFAQSPKYKSIHKYVPITLEEQVAKLISRLIAFPCQHSNQNYLQLQQQKIGEGHYSIEEERIIMVIKLLAPKELNSGSLCISLLFPIHLKEPQAQPLEKLADYLMEQLCFAPQSHQHIEEAIQNIIDVHLERVELCAPDTDPRSFSGVPLLKITNEKLLF